MSMLNNPLVGAIGAAMIGADPSGPVASIASNLPPSMSMGADSAPKPEVAKPPVPLGKTASTRESMDVRQHYPQAKAPSAASTRGLSPGLASGMNLPGVMDPQTLMHPAVQQLLGQYGITPEQLQQTVKNASPDMFVTDPTAHQNHPVLSGLLERGLEGAAFTQGSHTWGEGISNVAQGMLEANGARANKYNNQLMMPFAQASQVAQLKGTNLQQQYEEAQARRDDALVKHYGDMDATREELNSIKKELADNQKRQLNLHQNIGLMQMLQKTPLNAAEQASYEKMVDASGGDAYEVPSEQLQSLINTAAQRKIDEEHQNKLNVAKVAGGARVGAAAAGNPLRGDAIDAAARRADLLSKQQTEQKFIGDLQQGVANGPDGLPIVAGSQQAQAYLSKLHAQTMAAQDAVVNAGSNAVSDGSAGQIATPDKLVVKPTSIKTYDVNTGTIH
jgi:hypothetical protein